MLAAPPRRALLRRGTIAGRAGRNCTEDRTMKRMITVAMLAIPLLAACASGITRVRGDMPPQRYQD
jgi:hypothetical protein